MNSKASRNAVRHKYRRRQRRPRTSAKPLPGPSERPRKNSSSFAPRPFCSIRGKNLLSSNCATTSFTSRRLASCDFHPVLRRPDDQLARLCLVRKSPGGLAGAKVAESRITTASPVLIDCGCVRQFNSSSRFSNSLPHASRPLQCSQSGLWILRRAKR